MTAEILMLLAHKKRNSYYFFAYVSLLALSRHDPLMKPG